MQYRCTNPDCEWTDIDPIHAPCSEPEPDWICGRCSTPCEREHFKTR